MSSQTLLRNVLEAALVADLSKNDWRVLAVLMMQTLGYGKPSDPLTTKRIAIQSGIRTDRVQPHIDNVTKAGLFETEAHPYFDATYSIPVRFFDDEPSARFFAPSTPRAGESSQKGGQKSQVVGTYRDTTFTELNITDTTDAHIELAACKSNRSRSDIANAVKVESIPQPITKPENVPTADFEQLLPALKKLPTPTANDILGLVSLAIIDNTMKTTPKQLGGGLINQYYNGRLNTAPLRQYEAKQSVLVAPATAVPVKNINLQGELDWLKRTAKMMGQGLHETASLLKPALLPYLAEVHHD